jgi:hypothetical protein
MAIHHLSRAALERLQAEFDDLTTRGRIEVAQKIETARLMGDLSENGDYHAAKDEQGHMEGRIRHLERDGVIERIEHRVRRGGPRPRAARRTAAARQRRAGQWRQRGGRRRETR